MYPPLWTTLLLLLLDSAASAAGAKPKNAILLSDVQSLTLRGGGAQTAHRRVSAIPQLRCVSSPALCNLHEIDVMRCTNQGSGYDAQDIQWSCTASLPPELKLGSTDVICEGYSSPDDPYVLKGSCGVEYRLLLTESGEAKFPDIGKEEHRASGGPWESVAGILFGLLFASICILIIYNGCINARNNPGAPRRPRDNRWGGGGGGGGGGFDPGFGPGGGHDSYDPPPPYPGSKYSSTTREQQGWRPGFWSGAATGAAAGYAAGSRRSGQDRRGSSYESRAGPSSSSSTSSARYEGTGFGSTSRR
ncbi:hypothetical protein F4774DRAFT_412434 [Daldinia eschscholtzii]|nr:hypothetical protein F4774DRAFT_412434 [Daldinia eschscholtzii]